MATKKKNAINTEWERKRYEAEQEALNEGGFRNEHECMVARLENERIVLSVGLTPQRVWDITRHMRKAENGGGR